MSEKYLLLKEAKNKKKDLEKEILRLLQEFEDETKTQVDSIELENILSYEDRSRVVDISIKVVL